MDNFLIYIVTWNVGGNSLDSSKPTDLRALLGLQGQGQGDQSFYSKLPDLYIIGFQEVKSQPQNLVYGALFEDPWTTEFRNTLSPFGYVKVQQYRMQGMLTLLFLKRKHLISVRDLEMRFTRRGFGGIWGNKGAISTRLGLHGVSLCLVNCHLSPHDDMLSSRIEDYKQILTTQEFTIRETSNILYHDYVFWFGDLNFRLGDLTGELTAEKIVELVSKKELSKLWKSDELSLVQSTGDAFSELKEPSVPVDFPPTYKFEAGRDSYDIKRRPAWTDRILYSVNSSVYEHTTLEAKGSNYKAHMNYRNSDHRPVTCSFEIQVFRPTVEEMLVNFIGPESWNVYGNNKVFYTVNSNLETSPQDWIGIYKADFTGLDEYVGYSYVGIFNGDDQSSTCTDDDGRPSSSNSCSTPTAPVIEKWMEFSETSITFEGDFVLIYFSQEPKSIYGISQAFHASLPSQLSGSSSETASTAASPTSRTQ